MNDIRKSQITQTIDGSRDYDPVEEGRKLVERMKRDGKGSQENVFTTSQLRKILSAAAVIKNMLDIDNLETIPPKIQSEIQYLHLKLIYQMGREKKLKRWLISKELDMPSIIKNIGNSRARFDNYYRLLESIVAYLKYEFGNNV
jgi:CRISPR-associated protein Csm2